MKKRGLSVYLVLSLVLMLTFVSAADFCDPTISLINQDPYPAIPGDYVELVFQVDGVENPDCGEMTFELKENFPISFDPLSEPKVEIKGGFYERTYGSFLIVPYKVRVDEQALDGDNPIEVVITSKDVEGSIFEVKEFQLNVEDSRVDFEIFIKNYDPLTKIITLEILNTGKSDIEALTIEIPKQDHIEIKGPNRNIVGDLDSNEYTTAEFEAMSEGGNIDLEIIYTDTINVRRSVQKTIIFTPEYFEGRNGDEGTSAWTYIIILVVIIGVIWWWRKKRKHRLTHRRH